MAASRRIFRTLSRHPQATGGTRGCACATRQPFSECAQQSILGLGMDFTSSSDESLLALWESVRRQVIADRAAGGRCRFVGDRIRPYAHNIRKEMDRRGMRYTPIEFIEFH
jgi:predicted helicase